MSESDYSFIRVIGEGCMGKVILARHKEDRKLYAIKVINKDWASKQREIEHTLSERNILASMGRDHPPFLIVMHHSFQTKTDLYFVLDYCPGGDLATQLTQRRTLPIADARFYAAEIIVGLSALHQRGVIYRDLKPENILIDRDGHVVLTDFGLSKQLSKSSTTLTFCGTAEYLAPETLCGVEYTYAVDWFSLGSLIYEMLVGVVRKLIGNVALLLLCCFFVDIGFGSLFCNFFAWLSQLFATFSSTFPPFFPLLTFP